MFESIVPNLVSTLITHIINKGNQFLKGTDEEKYRSAISNLIIGSVKKYRKEYTSIVNDKQIPFYHSQTFFSELLKWRLDKTFDVRKIGKIILLDKNISQPGAEELVAFFKVFDEKLRDFPELQPLFIEINYKKEIFEITNTLKDLKNDLKLTEESIKVHIDEISQNSSSKVLRGIKEVKVAVDNLKEKKPKQTKLEIVHYHNHEDLFSITVLNNSNDSIYIKVIILELKNRNKLAFLSTPLNGTPYSNKEILVNIHPAQNHYTIVPQIYIKPKDAEILNFRLHRPDHYYGYEIMEMDFDIYTHDGNNCKTETIIDLIGHSTLHLNDEIEEFRKDIVEVLKYNNPIITEAENTNLPKSNRLIKFLENYKEEHKLLFKKYDIHKLD